MARPRKHDRLALVTAICNRISDGTLVKLACKAEGVGADQLRDWVNEDEQLSALYVRARSNQAHAIAEEAVAIADERVNSPEAVQRNRLRVDTRKWMASKIAPRLYSDRILQEHSGVDGAPIQIESQVWQFGDKTVTF